MLAKKLCALGACISFYTCANASFSAGSQTFTYTPSGFDEWVGVDSDVILYLHDTSNSNGTYFSNLTNLHNVTVDQLMIGENYQIDLGYSGLNINLYDSWGILASNNDISTTYSYGLVGVALGTMFTSSSVPNAVTNGNESSANQEISLNTNWINEINAALPNTNNGSVQSTSNADYSNEPFQNSQADRQLTTMNQTANLYLYGILDPEPEPLWFGTYDTRTDLHLIQYDLQISNGTLFIGAAPEVPIPASAYFFISGIAALAASKHRARR